MPITLTPEQSSWPKAWRPVGHGSLEVEPFCAWWDRIRTTAPELLPEVYEQWVYKHWNYSPYYGFLLQGLSARLVNLPCEEIVTGIGCPPRSLADPQPPWDKLYEFLNTGGIEKSEPFRSMNATGTWNYPILAIRSPDGFIVNGSRYDSPRWLIEGHQRMRYLKVLWHLCKAAESHDVVELVR